MKLYQIHWVSDSSFGSLDNREGKPFVCKPDQAPSVLKKLQEKFPDRTFELVVAEDG